jgi:hypothetical protein
MIRRGPCAIFFATVLISGAANAQTMAASVQTPPQMTTPAAIALEDLTAWREAERLDTRQAYEGYLSQYPNGWFKLFATTRLAPSIPADLRTARPIPSGPRTPEDDLKTAAWEDDLWKSAQDVGTHAAFRDYLLVVRNGRYHDEAVTGFFATRPAYPTARPADCLATDNPVGPIRQREGFAGRYPQRALDQEKEDIATGDLIIDYSGTVLAWTNVFHVDPANFASAVFSTALYRKYAPLRAGCMPLPLRRPTWSIFILDGDIALDSRPVLETVEAAPALNQTITLEVPADRAVRVRLTHDETRAVYEVRMDARFPANIRVQRNNGRWRSLANNRHFLADPEDKIDLRISAVDVIPTRWSPKPRPFSGPVTLTIRQLYRRDPNDPTLNDGSVVAPTPPTSPATPLPTP